MSHLTAAASSEDIEDEIIFTQTLIDSLEPRSEDFAQEQKHLEEVMHHLENLLQAKNSQNSQTAVENGHSTGWGDHSQAYLCLDGNTQGYDNQLTTAYESSSPNNFCGQSSNGHLKRPREPSFGGPSTIYDHKSRRTSPDTNSATVSPFDLLNPTQRGAENHHDSTFLKSSSQQALERRRQLEKEAYERAVQQRKDNEMARALERTNINTSALVSRAGPASLSTWTGPKSFNSHDVYGKFPGMSPLPPNEESRHIGEDLTGSSSLTSTGPERSAVGASRYDRPLPYLPSPNRATSSASNSFDVRNPVLKVEPSDSSSALTTNRGVPEIVDLTGNDSEEEITPISNGNSYPLGSTTVYGSNQYPEVYPVDDPFADLDQHQGYLAERVQTMPGSYSNLNGAWSEAYSNLANRVQSFGQVVGDLASSLNPFGGQAVGPHSGYSGYSSYGNSSGLLAGYGGYGDDFSGAGPSNPLVVDPLDNYLSNPGRHDYDYLYSDPTKTREEINDLLQNISADEDLPAELRGDTPEPMKTTLMPHQLLGLKWLTKMEEGTNQGGILADDMGLGKTIQALALMVTRPSTDKLCKTTLIIAPVALLRQWKREIEDKIKPTHRLSVHIFHGTQPTMTYNRLRQYDIVLTTFGKLGIELKRLQKFELRQKSDVNARPRKDEEACLIGSDCRWYRVIIDEAQCIKNKSTLVAQAACRLHAKYRLCMTGTPMMNNVEELYSLIRFLRIKPYCQWEDFRKDFVRPFKDHYKFTKDQAMKKLQALLKAILLRRTKTSKLDGQPIIRIPERYVAESHTVFSEDEKQVYESLLARSQLTFNKYLKAGTIGKNYSNMLTLLLRLRQCCCHPHLMKDWHVTAEQVSDNPDRMPELARKLAPGVVQRIKEADGNFECPVCYDAVENPAIFFPCGHDTCLDCFANLSDPSRAIREGDEHAAAKCPSCRGPIKRSDLLDYKTFKTVHMPETITEDGEDGEVRDDNHDSDSDSDSDDSDEESGDDVDGHGNLRDFIVNDDEEEAEETGNEGEEVDAESSSNMKQSTKKKAGRPKKDAKGKGKEKKPKKAQTLAELKKLGMRNQKAKKKYLRKLRKDYVTSSKIDKTIEILKNIRQNDVKEKTIIFSQWTSLLDLLEIAVDGEDLGSFARYDGSMNANSRNEAVTSFLYEPRVRIMLVSLKAGNAGLNLTAASQVIILDPFWNPFIEEQAIDRAHRIGQQRNVQVHRVLIEGTVEDRIIELQEKKRELITTALDEGESKKLGRLSTNELAYLFGVSGNPNAA